MSFSHAYIYPDWTWQNKNERDNGMIKPLNRFSFFFVCKACSV